MHSSFLMPPGTTLESFTAAMAETVPRYRLTPGLLRKHYVYDPEGQAGGGIYCFDTRANAQSCFNAEMVARATSRFGTFALRWFECPIVIDNVAGVVEGPPRL